MSLNGENNGYKLQLRRSSLLLSLSSDLSSLVSIINSKLLTIYRFSLDFPIMDSFYHRRGVLYMLQTV
ncbi:hypothetical protein Ancab_004012 [Ancistrocladus abbreviatus]